MAEFAPSIGGPPGRLVVWLSMVDNTGAVDIGMSSNLIKTCKVGVLHTPRYSSTSIVRQGQVSTGIELSIPKAACKW